MIEKKIDKYISTHILKYLKGSLLCYNLDIKTELKKDYGAIYIKRRQEKDKFYQTIYAFPIKNCFELLFNMENLEKEIKGYVDYILKGGIGIKWDMI